MPALQEPPSSDTLPQMQNSDQSVEAAVTLHSSLTTISREDQLGDKAIGSIFRAIKAGRKLGSDTLQSMSPEN